MLDKYNKLRDRALALSSTKELTYRNLVNAQHMLDKNMAELKEIKEDRLIQESSIKVLNQIIDTMSKDHIKSIVDLVTYGLQTIFTDKDYSLELEVKELRNKNTCQFYLLEKTEEGVKKVILDDTGGGIKAVVGFVLQVFYIMYYNLKRILFLDECLSAVSQEYLPSLMEFIYTLSEKRGFIFLAICHDTRFMQYADKMYLMRNGELKDIENWEDIDIKDLEEVQE